MTHYERLQKNIQISGLDAIFQGQAPQLRSLHLTDCNFSWTSCVSAGFELYVWEEYLFFYSVGASSERMPNLERLTLE
jgi:hypothetical protein